MSTGVTGPTRARIPEKTLRTDRWWLYPLTTFTVFSAFVVYATWRAFAGTPLLRGALPVAVLLARAWATASRARPTSASRSAWFPLSAALIILIFPLGFRMTCYYYRKAYYRSFWLSPPACGVAEPHGGYSGETRLPLILNNIHRYFWYAAVVVALILTYDTVLAFGPMEGESDGIHMGLGTLIFLANIVAHLALHALVPLVPPRRRRPAAALLQAPGPLPALDRGSPG